MARGTNNRVTRLILTAPFASLGISARDIDNSAFLRYTGTNRNMVEFLIPIVNDIIARRPNKIVREMPVRQATGTRGTFKEFITTDDIEINIDAMMTYFYRSELNFKGGDRNYILGIIDTLIDGVETSGIIPHNDLGITSRQDLVNYLDRLGIYKGGLLSFDTGLGLIREAVRINRLDSVLQSGNAVQETVDFNVFGQTGTLSVNQATRALGASVSLARDYIRGREGRGFADDNMPLREFQYLLRYANVSNELAITHPVINKLGVKNVVISNVENLRITSEHQLGIRIKMYSDDISLYQKAQINEGSNPEAIDPNVGPFPTPVEGSLEFFNTGGQLPSLAPSPAPALP